MSSGSKLYGSPNEMSVTGRASVFLETMMGAGAQSGETVDGETARECLEIGCAIVVMQLGATDCDASPAGETKEKETARHGSTRCDTVRPGLAGLDATRQGAARRRRRWQRERVAFSLHFALLPAY